MDTSEYDYDYGNEEEEVDIDQDDGDEDEIEEIHDRLLAAIDQFAKQPVVSAGKSKKNNKANERDTNEGDNSLSLDALIGALSDSKDLRTVKKNLDDFEKTFNPVEKVISQRIERTLQYGSTQKDMEKWQETVTTNRHVKTLDLAQDKRQLPSHKSLIHKFEPETEMEKEIHMVLLKSGGTEKATQESELEELRGSGLTPQELREKQASLAKVKALMFYEQLKRHRLNKIKSKAYRRIRKKQKQRLQQSQSEGIVDEDDDEEEQKEKDEKEALKRVQERMDLRHKNTNRWSKMALKYGRSDTSLR